MWMSFNYIIPGITAISDYLLTSYISIPCITNPVAVEIAVRISGIYHDFITIIKVITSIP